MTFEVVVSILDDTVYEGLESFGLKLTDPSNVSIDTAMATATIASDEKAPAKLTVGVKKTTTSVIAKGTISYAVTGMKIRITLLKRSAGHWVKFAAKTITANARLLRIQTVQVVAAGDRQERRTRRPGTSSAGASASGSRLDRTP